MSRLLTSDERRRFSEWCRQDSASNDAIAAQMEKTGLPHMAALAKVKRHEAAAEAIVANILDSVDDS